MYASLATRIWLKNDGLLIGTVSVFSEQAARDRRELLVEDDAPVTGELLDLRATSWYTCLFVTSRGLAGPGSSVVVRPRRLLAHAPEAALEVGDDGSVYPSRMSMPTTAAKIASLIATPRRASSSASRGRPARTPAGRPGLEVVRQIPLIELEIQGCHLTVPFVSVRLRRVACGHPGLPRVGGRVAERRAAAPAFRVRGARRSASRVALGVEPAKRGLDVQQAGADLVAGSGRAAPRRHEQVAHVGRGQRPAAPARVGDEQRRRAGDERRGVRGAAPFLQALEPTADDVLAGRASATWSP